MSLDLATVHLSKGSHRYPAKGTCLLEATALFAEEPMSIRPRCVSTVLRTFGICLNDILPDDLRQQLVPLIPSLVGTAKNGEDDGLDEVRSHLAIDWLVRTYAPIWLDLIGLFVEARTLRSLHRLDGPSTVREAAKAVRRVKVKSKDAISPAAKSDMDYDISSHAAYNTGGTAAWDAWDAWDATGDSRAFVQSIYGDAYDVWEIGQNATLAAVRAGLPLEPAIARLQTSAIDLLERMIGTSF